VTWRVSGSIPVSATNSSNTYRRRGIMGYHAQTHLTAYLIKGSIVTHATRCGLFKVDHRAIRLSPSVPVKTR
jgi:hypothetical protein